MIRMRGLYRSFFDFWETAQGKSQEEQLELWQELYESKHPEVFQVYFSAPYWGRREDLPEALLRYGKEIERIVSTRETEKLIPQITEGALAAFAAGEDEIEIDVIYFIGVYGADGFSFPLADRATIFLALERLAEYKADRMKALIAHELSHGFHMELGRRANPEIFMKMMKNLQEFESWIARNVFSEGLATSASKRIVPGLDEKIYLFYSPEQWDWCQRNKKRLIEMILKRLDSRDQDTFYKFFTIWKPTEELPYHRTGYYVGYLAMEKLLKRYSLRELAEIGPENYSKLIRQALARR